MSGLSRVLTRISRRHVTTKPHDPHAIWREINRLGSEGKWDNINNMPKAFLFGKAKKEAYAAYNAINHKTDIWSSSPYGQFAKGIFRLAVAIFTIQAKDYGVFLLNASILHFENIRLSVANTPSMPE
ncbi:hypothetical protein RB195_014743 [Necator americanus]|uniref:Uncharacterized protein n=1 Tax=Necator americanus TaxID=51031 RepID=A0ABR1E1U5_NECAM